MSVWPMRINGARSPGFYKAGAGGGGDTRGQVRQMGCLFFCAGGSETQ